VPDDPPHRRQASDAACHCDRWSWPDAHHASGPQKSGPQPDAVLELGDLGRESGLESRHGPGRARAAQGAAALPVPDAALAARWQRQAQAQAGGRPPQAQA
jgi:hypothetical protein